MPRSLFAGFFCRYGLYAPRGKEKGLVLCRRLTGAVQRNPVRPITALLRAVSTQRPPLAARATP